MASLDATSCRPDPQNGFPSTLSVLGTAVIRHFHYLHRATPSKFWPVYLPQVRQARPLRCHLRCPRLPSGDVVNQLSNYGQLPFRLTILPSSGSQRSQEDMTSESRDNGTRLINRAARGSSHIRPSSGDVVDVVEPLYSYGQLPFRLAILRSLRENPLCVTSPPPPPDQDVHAPDADGALVKL
ncbi:hypothetical protein DPMN_145471 [Dreissena polymorpha]|uniref:Uncharacterized protein n=1 Tax=Dreissena polymorpha TaxID=45954 RepID=A0A9D4F574_DREPO|nr:hypothetical protein DPMN_145471 [Dreissena polymorpha]